ncbi:MAG: type II toxin-antitoxin system VapC family toxin [Verrucomicrobia subdivision 3 bacterium]|nr:type II toxin-antitoxin system VapC family toxin [Limisphaerales bacterium]
MRKGRRCDSAVARWVEPVDAANLWISVLALVEIRNGIDRLKPRDPATAKHLEIWLQNIHQRYENRILPVTSMIAVEWGRLNAMRPLPVADSLMAATANVHGLIFVTRNTKDLAETGVRFLDPFAG